MAIITASPAGGNWSSTAAWVGGVLPGIGDDVLLTVSSGNIIANASSTNKCNTLDCTGYAGTLTISSGQTFTVGGNKFTLASGMTFAPLAGSALLFTDANSEVCNITTASQTVPGSTFASGLSSSSTIYRFLDNFHTNGAITHTAGTVDASTNSVTVTCNTFSSTGSNVRTCLFNGATLILPSTGTLFNLGSATNLTFTGSTSIITCTDTSSSTKTLTFFTGVSMGTINIPNGSTGAYLFNTNGTYSISTLNLGAGTTHTFQSGRTVQFSTAFNATGTNGNLVTINSSVSGTAAIFSWLGSGKVSGGGFLSVKDNTPTQSSTWYAGDNSTAVSNTGNWIFSAFITVTFTSSLGLSTAENKQINIPISAGVTFIGNTFKSMLHSFSASLGFSTNFYKINSKVINGVIVFTGGITRGISKTVVASLTFASTALRLTSKLCAAAINFVGALGTVHTMHVIFVAVLSTTSNIAKESKKAFAGAVSFLGSVGRSLKKALMSVLSFNKPSDVNTAASIGNGGFAKTYFGQVFTKNSASVATLLVRYVKSKGLSFVSALAIKIRPTTFPTSYLPIELESQNVPISLGDNSYITIEIQ